jgi:hypothetical protein
VLHTHVVVELDERLAWLRRAAPALAVQAVDEALVGHSGRARLALERTTAVKYAYLDAPERAGLPLRLYPADTLGQARVFYASPARVQRTLALRGRGWRVVTNFHFGYRERGLCWSRSALPVDDYADYWVARIGRTTAISRDEWRDELDRLISDGIFDATDRPQFDSDFTKTQRPFASPRPSLELTRYWPQDEAGRGDFPRRLRAALSQALEAIGEGATALGAATA